MFKQNCIITSNLLFRLRRIEIFISVIIVALNFTACSAGSSIQKQEKNANTEMLENKRKDYEDSAEDTVENADKIEMSMEDAIAIGMEEAAKYYENLQLTEVHSYDTDTIPDMEAGTDGKREWWYVNFANEELNYVNVLIGEGEVAVVENYDEQGNNGLLNLSDIQLTAKEAVLMAQEMGLRGGNPDRPEEWVSGYNFKLSYGSLVESPQDTRIFLEVIGISPNGNFAHIDFDAVTGEVILAEEKIEHRDGSVEWKNLNYHSKKTHLDSTNTSP